jgi:hypothetical protein
LQILQAIPAQAIIVTLFNVNLLFQGQLYAKALALGDITRLTFKSLFTSRAAFYFMLAHRTTFL